MSTLPSDSSKTSQLKEDLQGRMGQNSSYRGNVDLNQGYKVLKLTFIYHDKTKILSIY